ncbi:MAG TPA: PIN domain-containing protein [Terrimicrobiaceae bacterium]|nr:PIN domain-containing protein [Terrimicrobiaceae bacterium]
MNHVFVDFENVHEIDLSVIGSKSVSFMLLLGAKQTKLDAGLVEKMMEHAASVQLVRLATSGKNALDFALSYYIGRAVVTDPTGYFHIISKDTGFDPLVEHLRSRHIHARRHDDFTSLTFSAPVKVPKVPVDELMAQTLEYLRKKKTNRPPTKKTLASDLLAHLGKSVTEGHVASLIDRMIKAGHLSVGDKNAVTYRI